MVRNFASGVSSCHRAPASGFSIVRLSLASLLALGLAAVPAASSAQALTAKEVAQVDTIVSQALASTGSPSASVAVVRQGQIVFAKAYGEQSEDNRPPDREAKYPIGSVTKQFTAAAVLLLAHEGKLSLDDPVGEFVPGITDGNKITIREILSHTSGIEDYWPQDYSPIYMRKAVTPREIVDRWAGKALDFPPGTQRQYSSTGYTIAGLIVEKVSGETLDAFRTEHIFRALGISPRNADDVLASGFPTPYGRYGLAPPRPKTPIGRGWVFAGGDLAMSASELARWDIACINRAVLPAAVWQEQDTPVRLADGTQTESGLGVELRTYRGHRLIWHSGALDGFTSENIVLPDDRAAVAVLVNAGFGDASDVIAGKITKQLLITPTAPDATGADAEAAALTLAKKVFRQLQSGALDRSMLTPNANAYFDDAAVQDYRKSLAPLGEPSSFAQDGPATSRGGLITRDYRLTYPDQKLSITVRAEPRPGGKLEEFMVSPAAD